MEQNLPQLCVWKRLRKLVCIIPVITVASVLFWIYRLDIIFPYWTKNYPVVLSPSTPQLLRNMIPGHVVPQKQNSSLVEVNLTKTLLVSAYLEHRTNEKQVRVIAVVLRSEEVVYHCHFYCEEQLLVSEGDISIHSDHFGFAYGTADIMCPLHSGCETPAWIAVTSAAANSTADLKKKALEVKNRQVKTDSFPYNFTVCISTMFDFTNVLQLVQSLEMLQLLGVNRVVIYKSSCSPETQRLLDYYTKTGLVEVIPWPVHRYVNVSHGWLPSHAPGDLHYFGQIPALNDCLYRYMYQTRYVALHDIDELILPQTVTSWVELLPLLERTYGADRCYMFQNNLFPTSVTLSPPASQGAPLQGRWVNVAGVNILAHLHQEPITKETQYREFKIIVNPRAVFTPTVHGVLSSQNGCSWIDRNVARMYHTRAPKQPSVAADQLIYDGRLLSFASRFIPEVNKVLRATRLLPEDSRK